MRSLYLFTLSDPWAFAILGGALDSYALKSGDPYARYRYHPDRVIGNGSGAFGSFYKDPKLKNKGEKNRERLNRDGLIEKLKDNKSIQRWLTPREIDALIKAKSASQEKTFDPYFWTEDGKNWKDLYPFVRPDYGWWMTKKISDYTVKISYRNRTQWSSYTLSGTGWFLDFEEPKNGGYPLKWYLVTNAHVIDFLRLGRDPYKQGLPKHCIRLWWNVSQCSIDRTITLYKDARMDSHRMPVDKDPMNIWGKGHDGYQTKHRVMSSVTDKFVWADSVYESPESVLIDRHPILWTEVDDVNLLYFPNNFMNIDGDYAVDMAFLEIVFNNELSARRMTNDIYYKYYSDKAYGIPLNFLSDDAERAFFANSPQSSEPFFTSGYPHQSPSRFRVYGNYSQTTRTASIAKSVYSGSEFPNLLLEWATKTYKSSEDVYMYGLDKYPFFKGSSGSMLVDVSGNVLGAMSLAANDISFGVVSPLRNSVKSSYGKLSQNHHELVTRSTKSVKGKKKFDLIQGVEGQKNSYADTLRKFNIKTYLSRVNGWYETSKEKINKQSLSKNNQI